MSDMDVLYILRLRDYACSKLFDLYERGEITIDEYIKLSIIVSQMITHGNLRLKTDVDLVIEKLVNKKKLL